MHGPIRNESVGAFKDIGKRELAFLVPVIVLIFWMGIFPGGFLRKMDASVVRTLALVERKESVSLKPEPVLAESHGDSGAAGGKKESR
jgi:NADH-quinone oxidoreductase subunit M